MNKEMFDFRIREIKNNAFREYSNAAGDTWEDVFGNKYRLEDGGFTAVLYLAWSGKTYASHCGGEVYEVK